MSQSLRKRTATGSLSENQSCETSSVEPVSMEFEDGYQSIENFPVP
ncbi:hypothetical protein J5X98_16800 [Leptothermofonsia sichuanensis E412]|nr:hypothetical protein [Leptothermofonsia sichuanensis]QZZ19071.1 hypothetical protein J5X98_16800 [Leptothermofonsia sichuanensis E412]